MKIDVLIDFLEKAKKDGYTDIFIDEDTLYGFDSYAHRRVYFKNYEDVYDVDLQVYNDNKRGEVITIQAK